MADGGPHWPTLALEKLLNTVLVVVQVCAELYRLVPAIEMLNVGVAAVSLAIDRQDGPAGGLGIRHVATLPVGCRQIVRRVLDHLAELAGGIVLAVFCRLPAISLQAALAHG